MEEEKEKRLARYEAMQAAVRKELTDTEAKMDKLKAEGKVKSATYRQLMGHKLTFQNMEELYRLYDL